MGSDRANIAPNVNHDYVSDRVNNKLSCPNPGSENSDVNYDWKTRAGEFEIIMGTPRIANPDEILLNS